MPKRTICIQRPAKISSRNKSLVIEQNGRAAQIPFEDIWVLILETHSARISTSALSDLVDSGIGVMLCGDDHMPNGLMLPIGAHSRHAEIVEHQLAISKPLQKQMWRRIVIAKIQNQARVLKILGKDSENVLRFSREVLSGDTSNRESAAACAYFKPLLEGSGRRDGPYAAALDYGYGILRAGIGRTAVSGGWLVSRGIHHSSVLNAFNLVDDLIEPFRPLVDLLVVSEAMAGPLTSQKKARIASIFEHLVEVGGQKLGLQAAIEAEIDSLRPTILDKDVRKLLLPTVIPLETATYE